MKVAEERSGHPNVLEFRHEFAIETTHGFSGKKARTLVFQMIVDFAEVVQQVRLGVFVLFQQHDLELGVDVLDFTRNLERSKRNTLAKEAIEC